MLNTNTQNRPCEVERGAVQDIHFTADKYYHFRYLCVLPACENNRIGPYRLHMVSPPIYLLLFGKTFKDGILQLECVITDIFPNRKWRCLFSHVLIHKVETKVASLNITSQF